MSYKSSESLSRSKSSNQIIQRYRFSNGIRIALVEAHEYLASFLTWASITGIRSLPSSIGLVEPMFVAIDHSAKEVTFWCIDTSTDFSKFAVWYILTGDTGLL